MPVTFSNLDDVFTYHPATEAQKVQYQAVRTAAKGLVGTILANVPPSADQTAAIRKVREAVMTANAAIALNGAV